MSASSLLIISAALHALWNFALKRSTYKIGAALALMIAATILHALYALGTASCPDITTPLVVGTLTAGIFEGVYFYLLTTAYSHQALGVAYTIMRGGAMVLVWGISAAVFQERVSTSDLLSVLVILVGIALTQRSFAPKDFFTSGAYAAYLCAGCIAGYHIAYGVAVQTGTAPAIIFASAMACGVLTFLLCSRGQAIKDLIASLSRERSLIAWGGLACALSFLLFLTALSTVTPGRAISLRNTSVVFGAILSLAIGERLSKAQWIGVSCVVVGVLGLL